MVFLSDHTNNHIYQIAHKQIIYEVVDNGRRHLKDRSLANEILPIKQ